MICKGIMEQTFIYNQYSFKPIERNHLYEIMVWRNEQLSILRTKKVHNKVDQDNYYDNFILPSRKVDKPNIILYSYFRDNILIGYGGLTNIDWEARKAEISFLIDNKISNDTCEYLEIFSVFLKNLKDIAFNKIGLHRLYTETYDLRPIHNKALEKEMHFEGRLLDHIFQNGKYVDVLFHGIIKED